MQNYIILKDKSFIKGNEEFFIGGLETVSRG